MFNIQEVHLCDHSSFDSAVRVQVHDSQFVLDIVFDYLNQQVNGGTDSEYDVTSSLQRLCLGTHLPVCVNVDAQFPAISDYLAMQQYKYASLTDQQRQSLFYTVEQARTHFSLSDDAPLYVKCNMC